MKNPFKKIKKLRSFGQVLLIVLVSAGIAFADSKMDFNLGLDLKGGTQLDYALDLSAVNPLDADQILEGVQEVIRKRVDSLGVSEPNIYSSKIGDETHVLVELAGIDDIEEAKNIVGKTIQLEFREENPDTSNEAKKAMATSNATDFLAKVNAGEDFQITAENLAKKNKSNIMFQKHELKDMEKLSSMYMDYFKTVSPGTVSGIMESSGAYSVNQSGQMVENQGLNIVKLIDKKIVSEEEITEESLEASHILIAYEGSKSANETVTRTKDEALARANEVQLKVMADQDFASIANAYTDDESGKTTGGNLGVVKKGQMVKEFEEAAFALNAGEISEIVETDFGYHIIKVLSHTPEEKKMVDREKVSFMELFFSTSPDPFKEQPALTGEHFQRADVAFNNLYQPYVSIIFTNEGATLFENLTTVNKGKRIAIFVGGELISAPTVQETISGGQAQISGNFTIEEAQTLARDLNTGAIPAPIELVGQVNISASLGQEALDQSMKGGIIGIIILALFMILYYRLPGLIATFALGVYSLLIIFVIKSALPVWISLLISLGIFFASITLILKNKDAGWEKFISSIVATIVLFFFSMVLSSPITLTLAGVAGVILSMGMAVDANILIFERMREEIRKGKSLIIAIDEGFQRAWDSIRDSNFSSLITCGVLFYFGSSIIRGFAVNLALGILLSMFSAILLTRTLLLLVSKTSLAKRQELWTSSRDKKNSWNFIKTTRMWTAISVLLAIVASISIGIYGLNLGLDFTGGSMMQLTGTNLEESKIRMEMEEIAMTLQIDLGSINIVSSSDGSMQIRTKELSEVNHKILFDELTLKHPDLEEIRFLSVGPSIGASLKNKAIVALVLVSVCIIFYIAFAFRKVTKEISQWKFGISAVIALIHDTLITVGVFAILGHFLNVEIDALFITAILTVMGFSIHDTIVVFDRIRENLKSRKEGESLDVLANRALNETWARSINTSLSTLITLISLSIFGSPNLQWFLLALIIGISAGTYSPIFIASPMLVAWTNWENKRKR